MVKTAQQAYDEIVAHIKKQGGAYSDWYCGITENINRRLFDEHNLVEDKTWYTSKQCSTSAEAREVEKALLELGCSGGPGGGDDDAVFVYTYLKTSTTNP